VRHCSSEKFLILVFVFFFFELYNKADVPNNNHLCGLLQIFNIKTSYLNKDAIFLDLMMIIYP